MISQQLRFGAMFNMHSLFPAILCLYLGVCKNQAPWVSFLNCVNACMTVDSRHDVVYQWSENLFAAGAAQQATTPYELSQEFSSCN